MVASTPSSAARIPPAELGARIATALQAKALQTARQQGAQVVQLIADAGRTAAGNTPTPGDQLVAKATGLGGLLDVTA